LFVGVEGVGVGVARRDAPGPRRKLAKAEIARIARVKAPTALAKDDATVRARDMLFERKKPRRRFGPVAEAALEASVYVLGVARPSIDSILGR
jgi:hypothetical protein